MSPDGHEREAIRLPKPKYTPPLLCVYCGTKVTGKTNTCPNCGAKGLIKEE